MENRTLKFAFFGNPKVASKTLEILKESGYLPSLIITSPDKPQGRKLILTPTPVKAWAQNNNIPFIQPEKIDDSLLKTLSIENFDLFIVVAFGKILQKELIDLPKFGSINIHYSLLPIWRGASPVESAILNGDTETGVTIQQMVLKMDAGPIIIQEKATINEQEKVNELKDRLIEIGGNLLVKILPNISSEKINKIPQNEQKVTFSKKIKKEDGLVDINKNLGEETYNKWRAFYSWPRTFFFKDKKRIIITEAKLENGKFKILKVLPEGKKEIGFNIWEKTNF